jgi:hypothetical protein
MAERTKRELSKVYQDAMFKRHKEGDPDRTYVSDCQEAGQRACYELGASDARTALEAENAGLRARIAQIADSWAEVADGIRRMRLLPSTCAALVEKMQEQLRAALTPTTAGGSLWTTPARVGQPPLPEAAVDPSVTREDVQRALDAQGERLKAYGEAVFQRQSRRHRAKYTGMLGCALCGAGPWEPCARVDHSATPTTAGGTEKCGQCGGSGEEKLGLSAGNICTCRECHGTGRATAGGGVAR